MHPHIQAELSRVRRSAEDGQAEQQTSWSQQGTGDGGLLHGFVHRSVGVAIAGAGSTHPAKSAGGTSHFRDRTACNGVIVPDRPLPSGRAPNHMLTFRSHTRKLPKTPETTDRTEQAS
jgi:hypothetical protein